MTTDTPNRNGATATTIPSRRWRLRTVGFYGAVVVTIGLFVLLLGDYLVFPFTPHPAGTTAALAPHRFHDVVFPLLLVVALLGLVVQFHRPVDKFVGVLGFLTVVGLYTGIAAIAGAIDEGALFLGLGILVAALHPAARTVLHPRRGATLDRIVLGLVVVAAIPLAAYFVDQFLLQVTGSPADPHVAEMHYGAMATVAGSILVLAVLAALAPVGWRLAAIGAGLLALVWGGASVVYPTLESSGGVLWGVLAILWAVAFVVAIEHAHRGERSAVRHGGEVVGPA